MTVGRAEVSPVRIWDALVEQLAFGNYVPAPSPSVEEQAFQSRSGEPYHVLKHRLRKTYLSLPDDAYNLWRSMDGTKPIRTIALEYALVHKRLVTGRLRSLVEELRKKGFLNDPPALVFSGLEERRRCRTVRHRLKALSSALVSWKLVEFHQADQALGTLYRWIGRGLFAHPVVLALWAILVLGIGAWLLQVMEGDWSLLKTGDSYFLGFATLFALNVVATSLHELGHALATKHTGREVIAIGIALYYGMPCAYVDTTDMWMADRRSRLLVSWAGPFVSLTLAGLLSLLAFASPGQAVGDLAFKAATIGFLNGLFNLVPLLELDGYFMLVDALEMPLLRSRSFNFLRQELVPKLRKRLAWTPEERVLAIFGLLAATFSAAMLACSLWVWNARAALVAEELWSLPEWYGKPLLILFVLIFVGPLVLGLVTLLSDGFRWVFRQAAWRLTERRLVQRAAPLLEAQPYLKSLPPAERTALAAHLQARWASAGFVLVRQGDPPDGFYFIRSGEVEVERRGTDGGLHRLAVLSAGDHFGELAFLTGAPRNATVRARSALEFFYLDGGHFRRWLEHDMRGRSDVLRRLVDQQALARLPLLIDLTPSERDELLPHLRVEHFQPGAIVFRQGEVGDKLYLIVEGQVEVLVCGENGPPDVLGPRIAALGPGAFFGEIALLTDAPRTASIRALEPCVCYSLTREGFARLLDATPASRVSLDRLAMERIRETRAGSHALATGAKG